MKTKSSQLAAHIIGGIAFLSLPVLFSPDRATAWRIFTIAPFQREFLTYVLLLAFFYLSYFYLIPQLYFKKKHFLFILILIAGYLLVSYLPHLIVVNRPMPLPGGEGFKANDKPFRQPPNGLMRGVRDFGQHFFQFAITLSLAFILKIMERWKKTEEEKAAAELAYLKAQINPHFLFNTLNSIYSSAIKENADTTANAVVKLSGMMRYVTTESQQQLVTLEKEIAYITDYIELQQMRMGNTVQLSYTVTGNLTGKKIAPLILIPFIENAFKYGVNPEKPSLVEVVIDIKGDILELKTHNHKVVTKEHTHGESLGVINTESRLNLMYPGNHELVINEDDKEYLVLLKIKLHD
ncbi:MAG: histidine kinase [Sphingobacteriales bacterium]|nr:histidine kinase [Sphingobacteriales bacterium]